MRAPTCGQYGREPQPDPVDPGVTLHDVSSSGSLFPASPARPAGPRGLSRRSTAGVFPISALRTASDSLLLAAS